MESPFPNCLLDRISTTSAGMHSGLAPTMLLPNQLSFATNITNRGGFPTTRPPLRKCNLLYANADARLHGTQGLFQGASFYEGTSPSTPSCIVASIGGRILRFTPGSNRVTVDELTTNALRNNPTLQQAWMAQGMQFLVINDGEALPFFFDGAKLWRSGGSASKELPPGQQLHYCNGRFIEVLPADKSPGSYIASDLVYNTSSGTPQYNYADSILKITDNIAILNGQPFAVPLNSGPITSLFSVAIPDTSLGQGPLQVGTQNGVFSVLLPLDATLWTTTQQPSQTVSLPNGGPSGGWAVTTVNGDAWYRGADGLRSFITARRDFNTWVQTPLSFEMARILPFDTPSLLPWCSIVRFNNRLLTTCSPYRADNRGIAWRGLVALDFNNISSLTTRSQPAYDGVWTGLSILKILTGNVNGIERCFLFALDSQGNITLYELGYDDSGFYDWNGSEAVRTECSFESSALFGRESDPARLTQQFKKFITADFFGASLRGQIDLTFEYRPDQYPLWQPLAQFRICGGICEPQTVCAQPTCVQDQYVTFQRLPEPPIGANANCNPITKQPWRYGYSFQVRVAWTGYAQMRGLNCWALPHVSTRNVQCPATFECPVTALPGILPPIFGYGIESSGGGGGGGRVEWSVDVPDGGAPTWDTDSGSTIYPTDP